MNIYELTICKRNGDWVYWRTEARDYHAAAENGLSAANLRNARLLKVERMPDNVELFSVFRPYHEGQS